MAILQDRLPISIDFNRKHGAKMTSFGGWLMPTFFKTIMAEYEAVRTSLGLFDVSHMGRQEIRGAEATKFLSHITANNVEALQAGRAHYTTLLNHEGGIIDDLIIYKVADDNYFVVNNAGNHSVVSAWYAEQAPGFDIKIIDVTPTIGQIAVQGPAAEAALRAVTGFHEELKYFSHKSIEYRNQALMISATGYTGERGWELYADPKILMEIWQRLIDEYAAEPCGLGARDLLRLEAGYCLHGHDINQQTSPYEAGLDWTVKNPNDYIGKAGASRMTKKLVGLGFSKGQKILPREAHEVFDQKGNSIGIITSGNYSARLERGIALAYLREPYYKEYSPGAELIVKIRDKNHSVKVSEPWFYRNIRKIEIQDIA